MHQNKGKSIADCLADRTDYAKNPNKTNEGEYISAYECDPRTIQGEFLLSKRQYSDITGRQQENDVIAYQIRQSFKPDEVSPELANKIGYELGLSFTKGNHAFIVATHIDKAHIHNHIIFNSTSLDCTKKFRDFLGSGKAAGKISDRLCLENGLSIIENPKRVKNHYGKWLGDKKPTSHSEKLRQIIDEILAKKPANFTVFLEEMKADLEEKSQTATDNFNQLSTEIKTAEKRMAEITILKAHIFNYAKTRDVYTAYRKAGYSKKFYEEHTADLLLHKVAKATFDELAMKKLPTIMLQKKKCRKF